MVFVSSYLWLTLLFTATTPWQSATERRTPWGASSGASSENKVGFFQSLLGGQHDEEAHNEEDLKQLPWGEYESKWHGDLEGELIWPVEDGRISSGFGQRRGRLHQGLDIAAPSGRMIRAAGSGRVVYSGVVRGYGNVVVVFHGGGIATVYAHNRENTAKVGQIVSRGQTIATVGSTGRATGNHVHFEIRQNGVPINPLRFEFERPWQAAQASDQF